MKNMSIRLGDNLADDLALVSRVTKTSEVEHIRLGVRDRLDTIMRTPAFQKALKESIERDKQQLDAIYGSRRRA